MFSKKTNVQTKKKRCLNMKWFAIIIMAGLLMTSQVLAQQEENKTIIDEVIDFFNSLFSPPMAMGEGGDVGYEYIGEILHTWIGDSDKENIWFNSSTGYLQFFNGEDIIDATDRSHWLINRFGLAYYNPNGAFKYISKDHLNNSIHEISIDETTKWNQMLYKCLNLSTDNNKREFCAGWKRGQNVGDTYMKNNFHFSVNETQAPFTFAKEMWYVWEFEDIQIENDDNLDYVEYCHNNTYETEQYNESSNTTTTINVTAYRCDAFDLDSIDSFEIENVKEFYIRDKETLRGHKVIWNDTTEVRLRYEGDGDVLLLSPIGTLVDYEGIESIRMWWIDDLHERKFADTTQYMSGHIHFESGAYLTYNNTNPYIGFEDTGRTPPQDRGFIGFNISAMDLNHTYINITSIRFFHGVSSITEEGANPTDWINKFYTSRSISDNGKLEKGDWSNFNPAELFLTKDWAIYPEDTYLDVWTDNNYSEEAWVYFNESLHNGSDSWYHIVITDNSLASGGDDWGYTVWLDGRSFLEVNYTVTLPTIDVNITTANFTRYNLSNEASGRFIKNITGLVNSTYNLDFCKFGIENGSSDGTKWYWLTNGTVVANTTISGQTYYDIDGGWGNRSIQINCTDIFGYTNWSRQDLYIEIYDNTTYYCHKNYTGKGDWYISNDVFCDFEDIPLDGDIYVNNSAKIYWNNTYITCNEEPCWMYMASGTQEIQIGECSV